MKSSHASAAWLLTGRAAMHTAAIASREETIGVFIVLSLIEDQISSGVYAFIDSA